MKVKELIEELHNHNPEAVVKIYDYNPGEGWFHAEVHEVNKLPDPNEFQEEVLLV